MSRTGVEPKPTWQSVPLTVRRRVEDVLGAKVLRGARVWGGYSPSPTLRIKLVDGRGVFFKAAAPSPDDFGRRALAREERVYHELGDFISRWAPAFYGSFEQEGWHVLLLEDLGPKSAPPWTIALIRNVARAYADFHQATMGAPLPEWLPRPEQQYTRRGVSAERHLIADLAGDRAKEALDWLDAAVPALSAASQSMADVGPPHSLLHRDTRSDNLRWLDGRLRLVDWPWVGIGPPEYDLVEFAQSIAVEGGPEPEQVVAWYAERGRVRPHAVDASVASLAGFFADHAWRPELPGLPRLRRFQRHQLAVTLSWAARRLRLPEPGWASALIAPA